MAICSYTSFVLLACFNMWQACWQAGIDLNELLVTFDEKISDMARRGVPKWKQQAVSEQAG
jgi:hypothetical protein